MFCSVCHGVLCDNSLQLQVCNYFIANSVLGVFGFRDPPLITTRISVGQIKESAVQVRTAGGLSFLTTKVEGQRPNSLSLQLTSPSKEGC